MHVPPQFLNTSFAPATHTGFIIKKILSFVNSFTLKLLIVSVIKLNTQSALDDCQIRFLECFSIGV